MGKVRSNRNANSSVSKYTYQHGGGGGGGRCGWKGPTSAAQVGPALNYGDLNSLPGAAGVQGVTNHYAYNAGVVEPPVSTSNTLPMELTKAMAGGKRKTKRRRRCGCKSRRRKMKRGGTGKRYNVGKKANNKKNGAKTRKNGHRHRYGHQSGGVVD